MQGTVLAESTDIFEGCVILLGALGLRNCRIRPDEVVCCQGGAAGSSLGLKVLLAFFGFVFENLKTFALVILCH